jgi:hypothetical protein
VCAGRVFALRELPAAGRGRVRTPVTRKKSLATTHLMVYSPQTADSRCLSEEVKTVLRLDQEELDELVAWSNELIPATEVWPSPEDAGIEVFFRRIFGEEGDAARVRRGLDGLRQARAAVDGGDRVTALRAFEDEQPLVFRALLEFVYFGYYSRPRVVAALNASLGCDYVSPPQPSGYQMDRDGDPTPSPRGTYTPTESVKPVDLDVLADHAPTTEVRAGANPRFGNSATLFT